MDEETIESRLLMSAGVAYLVIAIQGLYAFGALREGAGNWLAIVWRVALTAGLIACSKYIQTGTRWASAGLLAYLVYLIVFCMKNGNGLVDMMISFAAFGLLFPAVRGLQASLALFNAAEDEGEIDF